MLGIVAKCVKFFFKKLSQFRLEFYKKYGRIGRCRVLNVEKLVECVEFHPESVRQSLIFEHSPQGFQHVEKRMALYRLYRLQIVENFCPKKFCAVCRKGWVCLRTGGQGVEIPGQKNREFYGKE